MHQWHCMLHVFDCAVVTCPTSRRSIVEEDGQAQLLCSWTCQAPEIVTDIVALMNKQIPLWIMEHICKKSENNEQNNGSSTDIDDPNDSDFKSENMNDDNYNSTDDSLEYLQNIAIGNIDIDISDIRRNSSIRSSYNSNIDAKKNIVVLPQEASDDECKNSIENVKLKLKLKKLKKN